MIQEAKLNRYGYNYNEQIEKSAEIRPFAFDLSCEYERAQQLGERGLPFFIAQAEYYAKETYGKVRIDEYEHRIKRDKDGKVILVFGPDDQIAEESYAKPAADPHFPDWYRKMSWNDVKWTRMMQEELLNAQVGDRFFDISPTVFSIPIEERKKSGFGKHSFACVSEYVIENDVEKLISRPIRNYLNEPEQELLFALVTGEHVDRQFLPRTVGKIPDHIQIGHIEQVIEGLYDNTPPERKIIPDEDDRTIKTADEMKALLLPFENWLRGIYYLMQNGEDSRIIEEQFRGWENAIKASVAGEDINTKFFQELNPRFLHDYFTAYLSPIAEYTTREYMVGYSSCGDGAGFSSHIDRRSDGQMTYNTMSERRVEDDLNLCRCKGQAPHFHCPGKTKEGKDCNHEIIVGKGITRCPNCGEAKKC